MGLSSDTDKRRLGQAFQAIVGREAVVTDPAARLVYESDGLTILRATANSCVPGEIAYPPHPIEERGLAQRL